MVTGRTRRRGEPGQRCRPGDPRWGAVVVAVLVLGACGGGEEGDRFAGPPQVGEPLPEMALPSLATGDTVSLTSLRGQPVVVNLWATWCTPCRHETPYLQSVYERYQDRGLRMVGITVDGRSSADAARSFVEEMGVTYIQLHDAPARSLDLFLVFGLPATYVADAEGRLVFAENRPLAEGDEPFESAVEAAVEAAEEAPGASEPDGAEARTEAGLQAGAGKPGPDAHAPS